MLIVDAVSPLAGDPSQIEYYRKGKASLVAPTVGSTESAATVMQNIGRWIYDISRNDQLRLVRTSQDVQDAYDSGALGVYFHIQGTDPCERNIDILAAFKAAGVGVVQLTYNVKNHVGDGATERTDCGLSQFGMDLIDRCNEVGIIVDCSHTGVQTTLEAIEHSSKPVVFSHANPRAVMGSKRNINDRQIKAAAATGGLVGLNAFPCFVSNNPKSSMDEFLLHLDYLVELVGMDHVGLGLDYWIGCSPFSSETQANAHYEEMVKKGVWDTDVYWAPPFYFPEGIETPEGLPNLADAIRARGYVETDVEKIMGRNWLRVFQDVWG